MYVLMYEADYEGQQVFGVYASREDAVAAADSFGDSHGIVVRYWEVGAAPSWDEGRLVYSRWAGHVVEE